MMTGTRLLLVDDDRLILATLARSLRDAGFEVDIANSGASALQLATTTGFDLAVLDMRMPGLSGIEVAQRLRAEHDIPALFLSAYSDRESVLQAVAGGSLGYVVKPVDAPQLIPAIEAALARARDFAALTAIKGRLEHALAGRRRTSVAIGILMERRGLTEAAAFDVLRAAARAERRKLEQRAGDVVMALEQLNRL